MKQWYDFYASNSETVSLITNMETDIRVSYSKLKQVASEMVFPPIFAYVPWGHHVMIMQRSQSIEEALFYVKKTVEGNLSRNTLDNIIRADLYHTSGNAVTNFTEKLPAIQGDLAQEILK